MKVKMLVAMAITGLFAATLAYATPTLVPTDDMTTPSTDPMQTTADTNASTQNNDMSNPGASGATPQASPDNNSPVSATAPSDDMSADTATGDDDY